MGHHPEFTGLSPQNVAAAADASLKRLQSDHIDLYFAHSDDPELRSTRPPQPSTRSSQREGPLHRPVELLPRTRCRVAGDRGRDGFARPVSLQPHYNLVHRAEYERGYAPLVAEHNLGVLPYYGLAAGFLTGKYRTFADFEAGIRGRMASQYFSDSGLAVVDALAELATIHAVEIPTVALGWLLHRPGVVAPIASVSRIEQLPALLDSTRLVLSDLETDRLTSLSNTIDA